MKKFRLKKNGYNRYLIQKFAKKPMCLKAPILLVLTGPGLYLPHIGLIN